MTPNADRFTCCKSCMEYEFESYSASSLVIDRSNVGFGLWYLAIGAREAEPLSWSLSVLHSPASLIIASTTFGHFL